MADENNGAPDSASAQLNELTGQLHEALQSGDQATAQRIEAERGRVAQALTDRETAADEAKAARIEAGEGEAATKDGPYDPTEPASEGDEAWNTSALETWRGVYQEQADDLIEAWGGLDSGDFKSNLRYARYAGLKAKADHPEVFSILSSELEMEDGRTIQLGDHPAMIKLAAQYGRLLAHLNFEDPNPAPRTNQPRNQPMANQSSESDQDEFDRLTEEMHRAVSSGLSVKAKKIERERSALAKRMWGDRPYSGPLDRIGEKP
jgi:hypothetical protein